jgi:glucose uptake protein GlcU
MRLTARNIVATLLVASIVLPYLGYLAWGEMPFVQDPRGMAAVGLILGLAAAAVAGRAALAPEPMHRAALGSGIVALALGIAALVAETSEALLALFVVAIVATWALGEIAALRRPVPTGRSMAHSA